MNRDFQRRQQCLLASVWVPRRKCLKRHNAQSRALQSPYSALSFEPVPDYVPFLVRKVLEVGPATVPQTGLRAHITNDLLLRTMPARLARWEATRRTKKRSKNSQQLMSVTCGSFRWRNQTTSDRKSLTLLTGAAHPQLSTIV